MRVTCYFDYSCGYSYRASELFRVVGAARPELKVTWRTYLLKEVNRKDDEPSFFDASEIESLALLALALSHAARAKDFEGYHTNTFEAFHRGTPKVTRDELLELASASGVDVDAVMGEQPAWIERVAQEHVEGRERWSVFGTPTLVLAGESAVYLKLSEVPEPDKAQELWDALWSLALSHPELVEIKRP
jgi:2-hydroxychromene-2-carboxylate isomerase